MKNILIPTNVSPTVFDPTQRQNGAPIEQDETREDLSEGDTVGKIPHKQTRNKTKTISQ